MMKKSDSMSKISVIGICGRSTFMYVDHFHENGETLSADSVYEEMGGKGINQAVASARMGSEVSFLCAAGDDGGAEECKKVAVENNIRATVAVKKGKPSTFAFILTDKHGENRVTVCRGAELCADDVEQFYDEIATSDLLLLQNEVPWSVNERAINIAAQNGVRVIMNPAPAGDIPDSVVDKIYAVTPNEHERSLIDAGRFANCITTLGAAGCDINATVRIPATDQIAVDTTGAGDTFNGVLAVCIADGMEFVDACRYAVAASGLSVSKKYVLASIPYRSDIEKEMLK